MRYIKTLMAVSGLALGLSSGAALAQAGDCPAGVARDGVYLTFPDRVVLARVLSDGRIAESEFGTEDGTHYDFVLQPLGLVAESWELSNGGIVAGSRETVSYVGAPDPMPRPAPGLRWDGVETSRYNDGTEVRYAVSVSVGAQEPFAIGPCSYTGMPVTTTRTEMPAGTMQHESMMHLPELGLTLFLGFAEDGVEVPQVRPTAIGLRPPMQQGGAGSGGAQMVSPPVLPPPPPVAPPTK